MKDINDFLEILFLILPYIVAIILPIIIAIIYFKKRSYILGYYLGALPIGLPILFCAAYIIFFSKCEGLCEGNGLLFFITSGACLFLLVIYLTLHPLITFIFHIYHLHSIRGEFTQSQKNVIKLMGILLAGIFMGGLFLIKQEFWAIVGTFAMAPLYLFDANLGIIIGLFFGGIILIIGVPLFLWQLQLKN